MFEYDDEFKHMAKYMDIYELLLANGPMKLDEIKRALMKAGVPETSARRNATDFFYSDSELVWTDNKERKYLDQDISKYFIYQLADALKVVVYGESLVQDKGSKTFHTSGGKTTPSYRNNNKKEIPNYEYREGESL